VGRKERIKGTEKGGKALLTRRAYSKVIKGGRKEKEPGFLRVGEKNGLDLWRRAIKLVVKRGGVSPAQGL